MFNLNRNRRLGLERQRNWTRLSRNMITMRMQCFWMILPLLIINANLAPALPKSAPNPVCLPLPRNRTLVLPSTRPRTALSLRSHLSILSGTDAKAANKTASRCRPPRPSKWDRAATCPKQLPTHPTGWTSRDGHCPRRAVSLQQNARTIRIRHMTQGSTLVSRLLRGTKRPLQLTLAHRREVGRRRQALSKIR